MDVIAHVEDNLVAVHAGVELVRDFVDPQKWISSSYQIAMPGTHGEKIVHERQVEVGPFHMLNTPVTSSLYRNVMGLSEQPVSASIPAVHVSWLDSVNFCNRLSELAGLESVYEIGKRSIEVEVRHGSRGFRLPTDAEWQFACRGMRTGYRYGELDEIGWYEGNSGNQLRDVGGKLPNQFGLFDMIGNVWEWCFDLYDTDRYGDYRVFRGGSYLSKPCACGATSRRKTFPDFHAEDIGFRVVRGVDE
ncbi:formylglycine-generating enzyme family protein [Actinomycetaceae bacterium TAE3-ERU4]|nr:formylglycine-generating enzyme family protein [Actinomycetaceae bacterium TAE3-ERU4]